MTAPTPLLEIEDLAVHYRPRGHRSAPVRAVDGLSLDLRPNEFLGLIGESGCGKSTLGRSLVHLLQPTAGRILFDGEDITRPDRARRHLLRRQIQFVFQDPHSSLNPRMTIREILLEPLVAHGLWKRGGEHRLIALLDRVGMPGDALHRYPHEFSGGQRQRIGLARALALEPRVLVLDEPVSALDVSVQAQVLNLLLELKESTDITFLMITHDLEVVRQVTDRLAVMYLGRLAEIGETATVLDSPAHPYTKALLSAVPPADPGVQRNRILLEGELPSPTAPPSGCRFRTRCWIADDGCAAQEPAMRDVGGLHRAACLRTELVNLTPNPAGHSHSGDPS